MKLPKIGENNGVIDVANRRASRRR
jgi:hypothetical protein